MSSHSLPELSDSMLQDPAYNAKSDGPWIRCPSCGNRFLASAVQASLEQNICPVGCTRASMVLALRDLEADDVYDVQGKAFSKAPLTLRVRIPRIIVSPLLHGEVTSKDVRRALGSPEGIIELPSEYLVGSSERDRPVFTGMIKGRKCVVTITTGSLVNNVYCEPDGG